MVRPLPGVGAQVDFQRPEVSDLKSAVPALVGFLAGVNFRMDSQVPLCVKVLTAHVAVKGLLAGMRPQVEN